jgi:farnesyl-diphosphate farnesyltransferase
MRSTNPREVAFIFQHYARTIHRKAVTSDPNFIAISVACGKASPHSRATMYLP